MADVEALPFPPRALNVKPSRSGSWQDLLDIYDYCEREGSSRTAAAKTELDVGRGHIQLLASIFHPDAPNDVAPSGYDHRDFPETGLEPSPIDPRPEPIGFRRAERCVVLEASLVCSYRPSTETLAEKALSDGIELTPLLALK